MTAAADAVLVGAADVVLVVAADATLAIDVVPVVVLEVDEISVGDIEEGVIGEGGSPDVVVGLTALLVLFGLPVVDEDVVYGGDGDAGADVSVGLEVVELSR